MSGISNSGASAPVVVWASSAAEINSAVAQLGNSGGEIRVVNSGTPINLTLYQQGNANAEIRIVADDPQNPPVFEQVKLNLCQNITFDGVSFDSTHASGRSTKDLEIYASDDITFSNSSFVSGSDGLWTGDGSTTVGTSLANIIGTTGFTFENNTVSSYAQGLGLRQTTDTVVKGNTFTKMVGDGIRIAEAVGTLIEDNVFEEFYGSVQDLNHSDMIQVWSSNTKAQPTTDLTIRDNVFNSSNGAATQTIFIRNEAGEKGGPNYTDILIENNTIFNGHQHGITVSNATNVDVINNTVLWDREASMLQRLGTAEMNSQPAIELLNVTNGSVTGNIVGNINAPGATSTNNILVEFIDPSSPDYFEKHFTNVDGTTKLDLRDLSLLASSPWAGVYGADTAAQADTWTTPVAAVLVQSNAPDEVNIWTYDASESFSSFGAGDLAQATYTWTFSDGTVKQGEVVTHTYTTIGAHTVELEIVTPSGQDKISRVTTVEPDMLLDVDFDSGVADASTYGAGMSVSGSTSLVAGESGQGFRLEGTNKITIDRGNYHLRHLESFTLEMSLKRDAGDAAGNFVHIHDALTGTIMSDGSVRIIIDTGDGRFIVRSQAGLLPQDGNWHDLAISFNGVAAANGLNLYMDDVLVAQGDATGVVNNTHIYDLVLGNTWGSSAELTMDNVVIRKSLYGSQNGVVLGPAPVDSGTGTGTGTGTGGTSPDPDPDTGADTGSGTDTGTGTGSGTDTGGQSPVVPGTVSMMDAADLLLVDFDGGTAWDDSSYASAMSVTGSQALSGDGFVLDSRSKLVVNRSNDQLLGLDEFSIGVTLEQVQKAGVFMHVHKGLDVRVTDGGGLSVSLTTDTGTFTARSGDHLIGFDDTAHRFITTYDGSELSVYLDGVEVAQADANGTMNSWGGYHFVLGNTWNNSLKGQVDDLAIASQAMSATEVGADYNVTVSPTTTLSAALVDLLLLDFDGSTVVDESGQDSTLQVKGDGNELVGNGFELDGSSKVVVNRSNDHLLNLDEFTFGMDLERENGDASGVFLHVHDALDARVTDGGALRVALTTGTGTYVARSVDGLVTEGQSHNIIATYDGDGSGLTLYLDGVEVAQADASGTMASSGGYHLVLGNTWGRSLVGQVDDLFISSDAFDSVQIALAEQQDLNFI